MTGQTIVVDGGVTTASIDLFPSPGGRGSTRCGVVALGGLSTSQSRFARRVTATALTLLRYEPTLPLQGRERRRSSLNLTFASQSDRLCATKTFRGSNAMSFVLAIDQGTTSSRAIVFRSDISIAATAQQEFPQHFPASGWVEHEPEDIWTSTVTVCREALEKAGLKAKDIAAIGITNQRETTVVWDRATGQAVHRAIVWQDRRTADICARLKSRRPRARRSRPRPA